MVFLLNIDSLINFEAIEEIGDLLSLGKIILVAIIAVIVGIAIIRAGIKGFHKQSKFEHDVDKFYDAWDSRNDRM